MNSNLTNFNDKKMCAAYNGYYKMDHECRGYVVIINNYNFYNSNKYKSLNNNVNIYIETFKIIGFKEHEIIVYENQTANDMKKIMKDT